MAEDYLGLEAIVGRDAQPAFVIGDKAASDEILALMERMHRIGGGKYPGALEVIFTSEEDGEERLEEGQAAIWQALMKWPREPDLGEIEAWKLYQLARLRRAYWAEFQVLDAATARPRR